jgi:hypothetical protein
MTPNGLAIVAVFTEPGGDVGERLEQVDTRQDAQAVQQEQERIGAAARAEQADVAAAAVEPDRGEQAIQEEAGGAGEGLAASALAVGPMVPIG